MSSIEWADPPAKTAGPTAGRSWDSTRAELRARRGEWACVKRSATASTATQWRKGEAGWTVGDWEVRTVAVSGSNKVDIYVRYIGNPA